MSSHLSSLSFFMSFVVVCCRVFDSLLFVVASLSCRPCRYCLVASSLPFFLSSLLVVVHVLVVCIVCCCMSYCRVVVAGFSSCKFCFFLLPSCRSLAIVSFVVVYFSRLVRVVVVAQHNQPKKKYQTDPTKLDKTKKPQTKRHDNNQPASSSFVIVLLCCIVTATTSRHIIAVAASCPHSLLPPSQLLRTCTVCLCRRLHPYRHRCVIEPARCTPLLPRKKVTCCLQDGRSDSGSTNTRVSPKSQAENIS